MNTDVSRYLGLCIGAQKCGTSSLHEYLKKSSLPLVQEKEHKAWLGMQPVIEWDIYADLARRSLREAGLFIEVDPDLSIFPSKVAEIASLAEGADVRLLFLYRDPAERILSQYAMNLRRGHEVRPLPDALRDENVVTPLQTVRYSYLRRSGYASLLSELGLHLPPSTQVTLASLEALRERPAKVCREWLPVLSEHDLSPTLPLSNRGGASAVPKLSRWLNSEPTPIRVGKRALGRGSVVARGFRHFRAWLEATRELPRHDPVRRVNVGSRIDDDWQDFCGLLGGDPITLPLGSFGNRV